MKIIDCPRDAMQGIHDFIPTEEKIDYINTLLKIGFDTVDFGSFVSPKAIPQLKDTAEVLNNLDLTNTKSKLLAIIANTRGAIDACNFEEIDYLGFPLSASEQFQQRNTNKSIENALEQVQDIQNLCEKHNKKLVTYISMGFGNPYNEEWSPEIVAQLTNKLASYGVQIVALSDTIGVSNKNNIIPLFETLIKEFPAIEFGAHMHSNPATWLEKIESAYQAGCRRFDGALKGFGGCPMAKDDLVGNIATENLVQFGKDKNENLLLNETQLQLGLDKTTRIFS